MMKTRCNQFGRQFPPPPPSPWESSMVFILTTQNQGFPLQISDFQIFRKHQYICAPFFQIIKGCGGWAAKKSAKHCYVCDSVGCLGTTAHPELKFADFSTSPYSDISYVYLPDFFHTLTSIFTWEERKTTDFYSTALLHIFSTR